MKKIVLLLLSLFPIMLVAQNSGDFFEHLTIKVDKTDINTIQSDFGPGLVNGELWYSAYTTDEIEKLSKGSKKKIFYNLFSSAIDGDGNITGAKNIQLEDISEGYHAGPVSYCDKTKELFVTLNNFENPEIRNKVYRKADIRLKIIVVKKVDGNWRVVEDFPYNNPAYSVGHPAISVTGDTLYFASNKPDTGFGETDLYMSVRKNGNWGNPVNLGSKINSAYDEMFPFLYKGSVLFYASNKDENRKGDLDILYACVNPDGISEPKKANVLNTEEDDFGLIIHDNGKVGYLASRRAGGIGDDDIYKVTFAGEYNLELLVMDKNTMQPVTNPKVNFSDRANGVLSGVVIKRSLKEGSSIVATSEIEGFQNSSVTITTVGKPYGIIKDTIWVEKVEVGQIFVLENIYYDFDKWDILPESEVELNKLVQILNENPSWKVKLGSHTDCRGSDSYNEILSQKRSDSAMGYIVGKGIQKNRISAKGFGETQLVNDCTNGVECPDELHRKNRRTEFTLEGMDEK